MNYSKTWLLKTAHICFRTVSVGQEFRAGFAEGSTHLMRLPMRCQLGPQPSERLAGLEERLQGLPTLMSIGKRTWVLTGRWALPQGLCSVPTTWQLAFPKASNIRKQKEAGKSFTI